MKLYEELLIKALKNKTINVDLCCGEKSFEPEKIITDTCYELLNEIRDIIRNDDINDKECFLQIERIVCKFEEYEISAGCRHDF